MPQVGPMEILVVCVVALVVFGPARLPEIARSVGKAISELKKQASDMKSEFDLGTNEIDADPAAIQDDQVTEEGAPLGPIVHKGTTNPSAASEAPTTELPSGTSAESPDPQRDASD